jgi:ABC-type glycerol-3-phosphate transport system substrate-binding protein
MSALALFGLWSLVGRKYRLRWATVALALTMLLLMGLAACGGGAGYVNPTGTPSGAYKVTVTGSSAGLTHSATVTLTVQ